MICPYCQNSCRENFDYVGFVDGGGDFGDEIVEEYRCLRCRMQFSARDPRSHLDGPDDCPHCGQRRPPDGMCICEEVDPETGRYNWELYKSRLI